MKCCFVYQRAPVSEFAPSDGCASGWMERLARGGIRALRARQEDGGNKAVSSERIHWEMRGPIVGIGRCRRVPSRVRASAPLTARLQPTSPPAPLQGRCVPLLSTPLPVPWRRDGLVKRLPSREGGRTAQRGEGSAADGQWGRRSAGGCASLGDADLTQRYPFPAARHV